MTIHHKICVAATILLALLLALEARKRSCENVYWRSVEAVDTADAVLRGRHDLGGVEIAYRLPWRDARPRRHGRLTPWERRFVVPLPPLPLDDPRLGDFADMKGLIDDEAWMSGIGFGDRLRQDLPTGRRQRGLRRNGAVALPVMMSEPVN